MSKTHNGTLKKLHVQREMEAVLRVAVLVLQAVGDMTNITVQLQPSVNSHSTFTDFYFVIKSNAGLSFIKPFSLSVVIALVIV